MAIYNDSYFLKAEEKLNRKSSVAGAIYLGIKIMGEVDKQVKERYSDKLSKEYFEKNFNITIEDVEGNLKKNSLFSKLIFYLFINIFFKKKHSQQKNLEF